MTLIDPAGVETTVRALGVDARQRRPGRAEDAASSDGERAVVVGEIRHVRLAVRRRADRWGCNAMARPALGRVARPEEAGRSRLARLDLDRSLVQAAQADPARFDALYRKYVAQVYSYAVYELRDRHEAEDATARTFLSALAALPRFQERADPADGAEASTFRVWLFRIARNAVAERRRTQRRHPQAPLEAALTVPAPVDIEARRPSSATRPTAAWRAIDRLDEDRRRAVVLRFVHELSTRRDGRRSWAAPRAPSGCSSTAPCARWPATCADGRPVTGRPGGRDDEIEALVVDRYLDSLLARRPRRPSPRCPTSSMRPPQPADRGPAALPPVVPLRGAPGGAAGDGRGRRARTAAGAGHPVASTGHAGRRGRPRRASPDPWSSARS